MQLLDNLQQNIEYIYYLGYPKLIINATNLPITLKKLYLKNTIEIEKLKIPFSCDIEYL
jgi:hypothetical protein